MLVRARLVKASHQWEMKNFSTDRSFTLRQVRHQQWGAIYMKKKLLAIVLGTSLVLAVGACGKKEESKSSNQAASTDSAEKIYQKSCAGCHGNDLAGITGPSLETVGGKYGKEDIEKIIAKGRGSMPAGLIQDEEAKKWQNG